MSEWLIMLKGHEFDLEELAEHFMSDYLNVRKDDGHFYMRSSDFDQMSDPDAVRERASRLLELMNGVMKLQTGGSYRSVELDMLTTQVANSGGRLIHTTLSDSLGIRDRATRELTSENQNEPRSVSRPPRGIDHLVDLADRNDKVADALRFYERGDWVNLYKAWEVVCDTAGGLHQVVKNGWAAEPDRSRFTGTAQSREELGDEARHASEKFKAPKNPMTLEEAQAFVQSVIRAWVATL